MSVPAYIVVGPLGPVGRRGEPLLFQPTPWEIQANRGTGPALARAQAHADEENRLTRGGYVVRVAPEVHP